MSEIESIDYPSLASCMGHMTYEKALIDLLDMNLKDALNDYEHAESVAEFARISGKVAAYKDIKNTLTRAVDIAGVIDEDKADNSDEPAKD